MNCGKRKTGAVNHLFSLALGSAAALAGLFFLLYWSAQKKPANWDRDLFVFCAAGLRYPLEQIADEYQRQYGVSIELQYGGSNTLLNQLEVSRAGDLYLAADDSYIQLARQKGLTAEAVPLARQRPVIAVRRENPKSVQGVSDLLRADVRTALANPDAAAIGKQTRDLLTASGHWPEIEQRVVANGVFKPTVNDVANDVKLGSVDAGIVWDSTVAQYPELAAVRAPELDAGEALIELAVLNSSKQPTAALRFARYVAAIDKGLTVFRDKGFRVVDGDIWEEQPELTLFAGAVNRRALEPIVRVFEEREGVTVNTKYDGCGILTGQMRVMEADQSSGFPDTFMACDVYYLEAVKDLFQDAVNVSDTDIVIAVQKGNPKNIRGLADLLRPDVRVVLGQPDQCTIGVLSRRLLESEGIYGQLISQKDVPQKSSSAMLVPDVATGAADAVLAYVTDTQAAAGNVDVIPVASPLAKAIQPFSISRSSKHKYLSRRLFATIARSRDKFESAGFHWRLEPVEEAGGRAQDDGQDAGETAQGNEDAAHPESP